ncbi:RluA family pseudouridine synthase [Candidatus Poribacteria bacterium]|nr:RluA family pseudouridine synthase [Candidatus Poribacteria bacterium]
MGIRFFYEDDHLVVVEKPAGILVHPIPGCSERTFFDDIRQYFSESSVSEDVQARLVHRLDRGTSGLMVIARTKAAAQKLSFSFRKRMIQKGYVALVFGSAPEKFTVNVPIGKVSNQPVRWGADSEKGKKAETFFETAWSSEDFSLLKVKPISGRTHQIRVHSTWQGHPIVGDPWYRGEYVPITPWQKYLYRYAQRLCLHAYHLEFEHPVLGARMKFWCPLPDSFIDIVRSVSASPLNLDTSPT